MAIFDFLRRNKNNKTEAPEERGISLGLGYNSLSSYQTAQSMRLSAVYAATNMISNSVALLPIKVVKNKDGKRQTIEHPLEKILNLSPNDKYNHFNFIKLLVESVLLNGNGYAYIERDENLDVKSLKLIDPSYVTPMAYGDGDVKYIVNGLGKAIDSTDMIHLYQHIDDSFNGISVLKYASMTLSGAYDTEKHSQNFFKSGAGLMGVLKAAAPMTNEQKKQAAESWKLSINQSAGGGVAVLPQGLDFQSISVSPEDAQLLASRQYNVVEIARFFNISPVKLFDYSNVNYSTLEQTSMAYLQDTILPFTKLMEDEFNRKLFKPSQQGKLAIDFDYSTIITTDKKSEAEYYTKLLTNGVLSINDVRSKLGYEQMSDEEGGNKHFIQISYATVENVVDGAYIKGQEQTQKVDNKVKAKAKKEE